ncbi:MAG: hypothetical protein RLZZ227_1994 [Pseudomonadota bacterium]|jgi:hypothetical protein
MKKQPVNSTTVASHSERGAAPSRVIAKCPTPGAAKKVESSQSAHLKFKAEQQKLAESVAKTLRRQKEFPLPEDFDERIEAEGWKYAEKIAARYLEWISMKGSSRQGKSRPRQAAKEGGSKKAK